MSKLAKALTAAAGNAAGESLYVEDVFSTYLWTGDGTTDRPIQNGIDLDGEGGLVWIKERNQAGQHVLTDTEKGLNSVLRTNSTAAELVSPVLTSFDSDGFSLTNNSNVNQDTQPTCSWTFRKAEKFFDVVTYTGNGVAGRTVSHNLGSVPGCIIVKSTSDARNWSVFHTSTTSTDRLLLNDTAAASDDANYWNDTEPTSSEFTVGSQLNVNKNGATYVAYLFASDAGGFGDDGSESIIKCGSFSYSGSEVDINLGFEPQFFLYKASNVSNDWEIMDVMRAWNETQYCRLNPHESAAEACYSNSSTNFIKPYANGVKFKTGGSGRDYIYIAIRRPMKTPESGTEVFAIDTYGSTGDGAQPGFRSTFPVDMALRVDISEASNEISSRLTQGKWMYTNLTNAEASQSLVQFDYQNGWFAATGTASNYYSWMFKRATGFFDVVAYTGDGVAGRTVAHNLGVAPELIIIKQRNASGEDWKTGVNFTATNNQERALNQPDPLVTLDYTSYGVFNGQPTADNITLNSSTAVNASSSTYIAYLFSSLAGVSKVGSYTGTGSNVDVDCGFSAGARFILIKRTDSSGDWYVYDSLRGIVAGNDPYLLLNTTAAEVTSTDYIDPLASGFTVTSSAPAALNASGGNYIFLAIA